jgi:hypothetical protein
LIVFGKRHIIMWTDGAGAALGLDPGNIYVEDVIEGAGTVPGIASSTSERETLCSSLLTAFVP